MEPERWPGRRLPPSANSRNRCARWVLLDRSRSADTMNAMRSQRKSLLVCVMTLLCPVWCVAELTTCCSHSDAHASVATTHPCGQNEHRPHHKHDPSGGPDSDSHSEHTCFCTGGAPPSTALQVPALEPAAVITSDELCFATLDANSLLFRLHARGPNVTPAAWGAAPLLI